MAYYFFFSKKKAGLEAIYVPQPFVENSDFHYFTLKNGLRVVVVNPNNGGRNSYVALTVGVGSERDPPEFIGFTHLIEHLLFTGSKNFPTDNYIEKVVNKYHGENNGVTKAFTTSYYYKLENEGLAEFAEVLVDAVRQPLFSIESIKKELNNVNSEISMRMTFNKHLAYYKLIKKIGNKDSHLFSDGFANIDPNTVDYAKLQQQIIEFHNKYYSANIMTLAIITNADYAEVRSIVSDKFEILPNKWVERPYFNDTASAVPPFPTGILGSVYYLKAFTAPAKFSMVFSLPSERSNSRFFPLEFFSIFLNHYSENSFKQQLISENLISNFYDEVALQDYVNALYIVSFELTKKGQAQISKIMQRFFTFIEFVKTMGQKKEIYAMISKISKFGFMFNIGSKFTSFSSALADFFSRALDFSETIQEFPPDKILTLSNILYEYNDQEFQQMMNGITPKNAVYIIESPDFRTTQKVVDGHDPRSLRQLARKQNRQLERHLKSLEEFSQQIKKINESIQELEAQPRSFEVESQKKNLAETARKLSDHIVQTTFYDSYFDGSVDKVELPYAFDFDNGRRYNSQNVPLYMFDKLEHQAKTTHAFDVLQPFSTAYLDEYPMITDCVAPVSLTETTPQRSKALLQSAEGSGKIKTERLFELVFNTEKLDSDTIRALIDLDNYKMCLVADVLRDDESPQATVLLSTPAMIVYHKLFRKTFQPKYILTIEIEMEYLVNSVVRAGFRDKVEKVFAVEVFCIYAQKHMELKLHTEYMKGNQFECRLSNYHLVFEFEGISTDLFQFAVKILQSLESLKSTSVYEEEVIHNIKERVINRYSDFESMTSLKLSTYYLSLVTDKLFVDYSSPALFQHLREKINTIGAESMASVVTEIGRHSRLNILFIGNIEDIKALEYSAEIKSLLLDKIQSRAPKFEDFATYRQYIMKNLVLDIPDRKHYMVRATNIDPAETNNLYLTYFHIRAMDRVSKVYALVMIHFLRNKVFDVLRNRLNLGYVAHAGLKVMYHNLGMIVLVQGESFRPNKIEAEVDDTLLNFLEDIRKMKQSDFDLVLRKTIRELQSYPSNLSAVSAKLFAQVEEHLLTGHLEDYRIIRQRITREGLYSFAEEFMRRNSRRITIELFAKEVTREERDFVMVPDYNLDRSPYTLSSLAELERLKFAQDNDFN